MNRLEAMAVFVAAVDGGSLSAAARKLRMPLPTVSRKLSDLEAQLKARLLIRSTRQLVLTDAGRGYLASCRRILEAVAEAEQVVAGEYRAPQGELIVSAPIVFGRLHLLPVTTQFLEAFPQVSVRLVLNDRMLNLLDDHIDVAVRIGELREGGLIAARVGVTGQVTCASPAYLARHGKPRVPGDLAAHACVSFDALNAGDSWAFNDGGAETRVPIRARLVVNTAEAAIDAAVAGVGLTRALSYQVQAAIGAGSLTTVLTKFEPKPVPVNLVYTSQRQLPVKLRAFLDFAAPLLRARLADAMRVARSAHAP